MFAGKKSAQIREILISESAWEEMTCLFAPSLELPYPSLPEQKKISDFLFSLDDKIAVKKAEIDKLKTWKQGLLQQMFV
ncbi:hypothetical protein KONIH1_03205 [Klebsiella oxytoca KONIH1]|nr:hypothetical protein KONIH1_03205 [Klebsiella oxytoca KONIH1]